ncbi:MAG: hypothetical protein ACLFR1_04085 [Spirochaetia bacterium]
MKILCFVILLVVFSISISADEYVIDVNNDGEPDKWIEYDGADAQRIRTDRNYDGTVDYIAIFDDEGTIVRESFDYNYDGTMDNFYFYDNGVLDRQEIDSNYDDQIDIWLYIREGTYITRYEQDTNHDGEVDRIRDYTEEAEES